jgi:hypothetical protein
MSEEYLLTQEVGELYPVLVAADGSIIDGYHRKAAKKNWKVLKVPQIKTRKDLVTARIIANVARRTVDFSESQKWVNQLASELKKDSFEPGQIGPEIGRLTGMSHEWVRLRLDEKFKEDGQRKAAIESRWSRTTSGTENDIREPIRRTIEAARQTTREIQDIIKPRIEHEMRANPQLTVPIAKHAEKLLGSIPILKCPHCGESPTQVIWKCCGAQFK